MALIKCKECGKQISDTATSCPHCGAKNKNNNEKASTGLKIICFLFPIIGIIIFAVNISSKPKYAKECLVASILPTILIIILTIIFFVGANSKTEISEINEKYENFENDIFTISYNKNWRIENTKTNITKFKTKDNTIELSSTKKSDMAENRNTVKKLKDFLLQEFSDEKLKELNGNAKVDKKDMKDITISGRKGFKFEYEIEGAGDTSGIMVYVEDDTYIYLLRLDGDDTQTYNKMLKTLKIK